MAQSIPVETPLGLFYGRDCLYLDAVGFEDGTRNLVLEGAVNGNLCTKRRPGEMIPYTVRFIGVLALTMVELDSSTADFESSFDEVRDSDWVRSLGSNVTPQHRHFYFQTYDDVFEVVCEGYEFQIGQTAPDA